jgi:iron complex outermembrane receptor protein
MSIDGELHDAWRWAFSYKYQDVDDKFDPVYPVERTYMDFERTAPRHLAKVNLGWQSGPWVADLYLRYQSGRQGIVANPQQFGRVILVPVESYLSVDGHLAYAISDSLTLALSGENLTRSEQRQTSAAAVERALFVALTLNFGSAE